VRLEAPAGKPPTPGQTPPPSAARGPRILDWGDSCVSHPFHSLTVALRAAAAKFDLEPGGRELQRLRDAYLEPFGDFQTAANLAYRTGTVARALAWDRFVRAGFPYTEPDDDLATAYGLKLFLANGPIGTWREPETSR
jgi:hypothetical protein